LRVDDELHPAAPIVTFALGPRMVILQHPKEMREASASAWPEPLTRRPS